jgi:formylglycine-generating enzyme required for sulfatase activity
MLGYVSLIVVILGLIGFINQAYLSEQARSLFMEQPYRLKQFRPYILSSATERALKAGQQFKECARSCPEMVVMPSGEFTMGSPETEPDRFGSEGPQHKVTIAKSFAVSKFDVTFFDWDACVSVGACPKASDSGFGREGRPVINVSWYDAQRYLAWLSRMTGKTYRLLSEAEWEYAARAGTQTTYYWGDVVGENNANCDGCGSEWDSKQTAPAGSFAPNRLGLYDMAGNVYQWVSDCLHDSYDGAPSDGSAWIENGNCNYRQARGGSWADVPSVIRSAARNGVPSDTQSGVLGFRIARTLGQ